MASTPSANNGKRYAGRGMNQGFGSDSDSDFSDYDSDDQQYQSREMDDDDYRMDGRGYSNGRGRHNMNGRGHHGSSHCKDRMRYDDDEPRGRRMERVGGGGAGYDRDVSPEADRVRLPPMNERKYGLRDRRQMRGGASAASVDAPLATSTAAVEPTAVVSTTTGGANASRRHAAMDVASDDGGAKRKPEPKRRRKYQSSSMITREWNDDTIAELQGYLLAGASFKQPSNRRPFLRISPPDGGKDLALEDSRIIMVQADKQVRFKAPAGVTVGEVGEVARNIIFNDLGVSGSRQRRMSPVTTDSVHHISETRSMHVNPNLPIGELHDSSVTFHIEHGGAKFELFNTPEQQASKNIANLLPKSKDMMYHDTQRRGGSMAERAMDVCIRYPHHHAVIISNDATTGEVHDRIATELLNAVAIDDVNEGDRVSMHLLGGSKAGNNRPVTSGVIGYLNPKSENSFVDECTSIVNADPDGKDPKYKEYVLTWVRAGDR